MVVRVDAADADLSRLHPQLKAHAAGMKDGGGATRV